MKFFHKNKRKRGEWIEKKKNLRNITFLLYYIGRNKGRNQTSVWHKKDFSYEKTDITFLLSFKDIALKGGVH